MRRAPTMGPSQSPTAKLAEYVVGSRGRLLPPPLPPDFFLVTVSRLVCLPTYHVAVDGQVPGTRDDGAVGAGLDGQVVEARPIDGRAFGRVEVASGHDADLRTVERAGPNRQQRSQRLRRQVRRLPRQCSFDPGKR